MAALQAACTGQECIPLDTIPIPPNRPSAEYLAIYSPDICKMFCKIGNSLNDLCATTKHVPYKGYRSFHSALAIFHHIQNRIALLAARNATLKRKQVVSPKTLSLKTQLNFMKFLSVDAYTLNGMFVQNVKFRPCSFGSAMLIYCQRTKPFIYIKCSVLCETVTGLDSCALVLRLCI